MQVVLRIIEGTAPVTTFTMKPGQTLVIGRGLKCDWRIEADHLMSTSHFSVLCDREGVVLEDLESTNGTTVNRQSVRRKELHHGDIVQSGNTAFQVAIDRSGTAAPTPAPGESRASGQQTTRPATGSGQDTHVPAARSPSARLTSTVPLQMSSERGFIEEKTAKIIARFQLAEKFQIPPQSDELPEIYAQRLAANDPLEAINFLAFALPKRLAVGWAIQCLRSIDAALQERDQQVLEVTENWVREPSEELRQSAMKIAQGQGCETAYCWPAVAAFSCHGSMAPDNCPVVPPPDDLCGKAVAGAITLAALLQKPEQAPERQKKFVELGLSVAAGEHPWK